MSQEIGPVTLCHSMSLAVTLTKDCATPVKGRRPLVKGRRLFVKGTLFVEGRLFVESHLSKEAICQERGSFIETVGRLSRWWEGKEEQ